MLLMSLWALLTSVSMKTFGNTIKLLLMDRGMTAKELASRINLSETSMSLIVKGVTKPRQANLSRIIEELCETPEEQQQLISAYARIQDDLNDEQVLHLLKLDHNNCYGYRHLKLNLLFSIIQ